MPTSAIKDHFTRTTVLDACTKANVPHGSALAEQLGKEATLVDCAGAALVQTIDGKSLSDRITELKAEAKFAVGLATECPTILSSDKAEIARQFDRVASGAVKIIDAESE